MYLNIIFIILSAIALKNDGKNYPKSLFYASLIREIRCKIFYRESKNENKMLADCKLINQLSITIKYNES